jgi:hypothetical protein
LFPGVNHRSGLHQKDKKHFANDKTGCYGNGTMKRAWQQAMPVVQQPVTRKKRCGRSVF